MIHPVTAVTLKAAADVLSQEDILAFPTETVYGLGGDATSSVAISRIYACKDRPQFNPLIIHVATLEQAKKLGVFNEVAKTLAPAFWPGPLTVIVPQHPNCPIDPLATAGLNTLAIRVPAHPVAQALLKLLPFPLAAPSANQSGSLSSTDASHVAKSLGNKIKFILDGGPCDKGLESTIIDCTTATPLILRYGALSLDTLQEVLGQVPGHQDIVETIKAPGQLKSHYAPQLPIRINVQEPAPGEAFLGFGPMACTLNLSPRGDVTEAAQNLFRMLHILDNKDVYKGIAVAPIPTQGLGIAIQDRLQRATAER